MSINLPPTLDLSTRSAIVTGGSRGIGKAISLELARRGANVSFTYTNSDNFLLAEEVVRAIKDLNHGKALCIRADMKEPASYEKIVQETLETFKTETIDIIVHSAASMHIGPTASVTQEQYSTVFDTNISGPFFLTQACLPYMPSGGRIILISSTSARIASVGSPMSLYSASKAALESLARSWAYEFGPRGITVNAVAPGLTETETTMEMNPDIMTRVRENYAKITPFGRSGTPDDVAQIVAFLASEGSRWVTGSTLTASGGRVLI